MGNLMNIDVEIEIDESNSNFELVCCIDFCSIDFGKGVNLSLHP